MPEIQETLSKTNLFRNVGTNDILKILSHVHYKVKHFEKDELIALSGEKCNYLLILLNGSVRGEMIDFSGRSIKIEDIKGPETVASAFVFGHENHFPVNITANESVDIVFISRESLLQVFQDNKQVLHNFLNAISTRSQFLTKKMKFLSFKTIQGKMAHYILSLVKKDESMVIDLPKSQTELANFFGVARPSLNRVLSEMEEEGIITVDKRKIKIHQLEKLKGLAV